MILGINVAGQGKPLVLFHGWGFDHRIWFEIVEALEDHFMLYMVDLPGFGHSPIMDWESFKSQLLTHLPTQFALAGWSMGGLFATRLAIEEPLRVSQLVNIASSPYFIKDQDWPGIERSVLDNFYKELIRDPSQCLEQFVKLQTLDNYDLSLHNPMPQGLESGLQILAHWDFRNRLADIIPPVCYMFGRLDSIIPNATRKVMQSRFPSFDYVLFAKSAHIPFLTEKRMFIKELQRLL